MNSHHTSEPTIGTKYILFVMQFLGAGFVAGSVVHFGEGVTVWDTSVLSLGICLFTIALVYRETSTALQKLSRRRILFLVISSLFLALTIGMASGGTQHFIDTPAYASVLIPVGLALGFIAFAITERMQYSLKQWLLLLILLTCSALLLYVLLGIFNSLIPDSLRQGHGSENHHSAVESNTPSENEEAHRSSDQHAHE
ncbi:MAG: hypothetical protein ABL890_02595 [Candidatus Peribacteraceae bacterium]